MGDQRSGQQHDRPGDVTVSGHRPHRHGRGDTDRVGDVRDRRVTPDAREMLGELAISAAGIGTYSWDLRTGALTWDERLDELFGYDTAHPFDQTLAGFTARIHPEDVAAVGEAKQEAVESGAVFEALYRAVRPDGTTRWVSDSGRALRDEHGTPARFVGAAYDVTARQDSEAHATRILEAMPAAFFSLSTQWRFTYVNSAGERLLGRSRSELLGGVVWDLFPLAVGSDFEVQYRGAMETMEPRRFDAYYPAPLDAWYEVRAWPGPDGLAVYFLDITGRRRAQHEQQQAALRAGLVASVTSELTETLDTEVAVGRLAQLVVPALADWCVVTLVDDLHPRTLRGVRDVGWWHADPAARPLVERYARLRLDSLHADSYLARALATGEQLALGSGATAAVLDALVPGHARDVISALAPDSLTVLPLRGRSGTVGLMSLYNGVERSPVTPDELATAHAIAGRAGLALDNSRLFRQQAGFAEGLQRALLTEPPQPDHGQIVVRYTPAASGAQVGGDWYDAFMQRDGATVLVIGDVVGHDTAAAATMGQVRSLLRGIAVALGTGPAAVLTQLDQAMRTLRTDTIATAALVRLEQSHGERERGVTRVRWSNAGHPPPMVVGPDGAVSTLTNPRNDPLLGILPDAERVESVLTLERGATVVLYTDGLVERRGESLDVGLGALRRTLAELASEDLDLDTFCDRVLERMLPPRPEDDVALIAIRLHRQDLPRPPEAGPNRTPPDVPDEPRTAAEA